MASVLILGAGSDVAKALAQLYASKGNSIQLAARNAEQLAALKSDIEIRWNVPCTTLEFDAGNFEEIEKKFSRIEPLPDIAICVFGYLGDNNISLKFWSESEKTIVANYAGAVAILNALAVRFAERNSGTIVGVSSVAGERGRQSNFIYGSAKAGFSVYLDGLRNWLYSKNVHVVTVKPGFIFTRMTDNLKLPPLLTASPELVASAIEKAVLKKKNTIYVKWFWKYIMLIIKCVPEFMFKKMKM
jgi:decaprenylphospho-beta-D-erythro-pentofuranosid-2-ulose 2-reductase